MLLRKGARFRGSQEWNLKCTDSPARSSEYMGSARGLDSMSAAEGEELRTSWQLKLEDFQM
jgi:hypothetical protein